MHGAQLERLCRLWREYQESQLRAEVAAQRAQRELDAAHARAGGAAAAGLVGMSDNALQVGVGVVGGMGDVWVGMGGGRWACRTVRCRWVWSGCRVGG